MIASVLVMHMLKFQPFLLLARLLKILHIGKYFSPFSGGLENYMRDAMVALSRRGIESVALVHRHTLSLRSQDEEFSASGQKFRVTRTGMWARLLYTPISPAFPWQLRRIIKTAKPDFLHLHLPNPSVFWALLLPSARRIPWVVHWHSDVITSAQGWLMRLVYRVFRPIEQKLLRHAAAIVATSAPYRDSSQALQPWLDKCHVVPLGVNTDRYARTKNHVASQTPPGQMSESEAHLEGANNIPPPLKVLAVGRLTYYKGFRYLVEAVADTTNVRVKLVGRGEEAVKLKELVTSLNLADRVSLAGHLSDDALAREMADCDCLCLPSIERTEAFGMVLLEAMYFGKATIIGAVEGSGMGWIVDDGVTGFKVSPASSKALAKALGQLADNREDCILMGQMGRKKFNQQFEINRAVEGLVTIYQQYQAMEQAT